MTAPSPFQELRDLLDRWKSEMTPEQRTRHDAAMAIGSDWLLYGEVFYDADGNHIPRNEARQNRRSEER